VSKFLVDSITHLLKLLYPVFKKWLPYQVFAYLAIGALNTLLNIVLFAVFYQIILPEPGITVNNYLVASYTIALMIAFVLTVPTGFWLSKNFAFIDAANNVKENKKQFGKYFLVVLQGLGSDYLIMKTLIVFLGIYPTVAKVISTVIVLTLNFLLQKYFTFKNKKP
jgi:putative flippase GtrA